MKQKATARACANIAFIKYWGNRDHSLRLPSNGSLSMNLAGLHTTTTVSFDSGLKSDQLVLNGLPASRAALHRVSTHLDLIRDFAEFDTPAAVTSENSFPMGVGIASSASAFATLTLAACSAAGLDLSQKELSRLARRGSGSASRSVPGGFVEWHAGEDDATSYAESIAPPSHWDLVDLVAVVSEEHKPVGSTEGHAVADSSALQTARVSDTPRRLDACRTAVLERDFDAFSEVVEDDALQMHAVMMTSHPPLIYWQPATLHIIQAVRQWREEGYTVCFTIDAGPNVHVLCPFDVADDIEETLAALGGVRRVLRAAPGGPAELLDA